MNPIKKVMTIVASSSLKQERVMSRKLATA
uniref:Uncharacterized protein n=1 Tax=Rhizophora mucronata TaxID=61149 RepID=A0A2P2KNA2_RHIMU